MTDFNLKSPYVIGGGLLLGVILLIRSGSSQTSANSGISSSDAASLQLANINAQQNAVAIQYQSANQVAQYALQQTQALSNSSVEQQAINTIGGVIQTNSTNNASVINGIVQGATETNLATIGANSNVSVVGMQTRASQAIATTNAGAAQAIAQTQANASTNIAQINANAAVNQSNNNSIVGGLGNLFGNLTNVSGLIGKAAGVAGV